MMKKKALIASVLLSVCSMAMSVEAAMTISSAGDIVLNETNTSSWTDLSSSDTEAGLTITGNNDKTIKFDAGSMSTDATIAVPNGSFGIGISHNTSGNTFFTGSPLMIFGRYATEGSSGYKAIDNQNGSMYFDNLVNIDVNVNGEAVLNKGTMYFSKGLNLERMHDEGIANPNAVIINQGNMLVDGQNVVITSNYNNDKIDGAIVDNHGIFVLNSDGVEGRYYVYGDIQHNFGAKTEINLVGIPKMDGNSYVISAILQGEIKGGDENFKLKIEGNHAAWVMGEKQDDDVYGVNLKNGGLIVVNENNWALNSTTWDNNYKNISFVNFKSDANSWINVSTDLKNNQGDMLRFFDITPDNLNISIINKDDNNGVPISESDGHSVTIARVEGAAPIKINTVLSFYNQRTTDKNLQIMTPVIKEEAFNNMHDMLSGRDYNFVGWKADDADGVLDKQLPSNEPYINTNELDSVFKRLMDIRNDPSEVGVWIRGETGEMKIDGYGYDYNMTSGGHDWKHESNAAIMFGGFGITHSVNKCDTGIIGDAKSTGYNLYGSWLGKDNNDYIDVILKYGKMDKTYAGLDINNVFAGGNYSKDVFSVAAKYGRRYEMRNDWYYEPFAGLTWGRISDVDFKDTRGFKIHGDSVTSKMANIGIQVGKKLDKHDIYYRMNLVHDFDGEMYMNVPGTKTAAYTDMGGTWLKFAVGTSAKVGKNNSFYIDLERDFGSRVEKPWAISAGYRHTW